MTQRILITTLSLLAVAFASVTAQASAGADSSSHADHAAPLTPSQRYSGRTPIDLDNGGRGNNGTYGAANAEYEAQAKSDLLAPGLQATPYAYERKAAFVKAMNERLSFFEEAILNLKERSSITKPEVVLHSDQAVIQLENLLKQTREAWKKASSANANEWTAAQDNARTAFVALYSTYKSLNSGSAPASK